MNNNHYQHYFEAMPCFLTVQDKDFRIIDANERFLNSFGDYEGRYCYQIYKQRPEKCVDCPVERTFRDGRRHTSEEQVKTLDGRDVSVIVYTTPIFDDDGNIASVMEMSTDITDIKNLQNQLTESQERYRMLFEEVPCYISIQDNDLRIIEANRLHREAFGTFYGCKCYKVYKHRDKACHPCMVRDTFEDGKIHYHEEVVTNRDGERINCMVTTAPIKNAAGKVESVIEMSTDITQIRQLQSKLASVGMIISSTSHDLKGLLNGMDGGIYLVNTGLQKDNQERVKTGWEMVLRNVDRIRSTVLDILYYAKDRKPDWQETKAAEIVDEVFDLMKSKAKDHDIEFKKDIDTNVGDFDVDRQAMRSLLINLIDNSFDACRVDQKRDHRSVLIKVVGDNNNVYFNIEDNGIGMDPEVCEKAFTLFFSSKGSGGTGLGLFIANKIAQSHGGRIKLESEVDEGTRFTITMPRKRPEELEIVDESEPLAEILNKPDSDN